jgi:cell division septation protein DedD
MRNMNLASLRSPRRSRRLLLLVGLLCVVFGSLVLAVVLFMRPEGERPQLVSKRIRVPITSVQEEEELKIPGVVKEEGVEEKSLEGGIPEEGKPIVSESPEPSMVIEESGVGKKVFILGEKEAPKEQEELTVAEGEGKRPEIEEKEEGKPQVDMVEEPKDLALSEKKLPTGGYTVNIASFKDKDNADQLMKELVERGYEAFVEKANIPQKGTWYRVAMGHFSSRGEALAFAQGLKEKGVNYSFVRKLDEVKQ